MKEFFKFMKRKTKTLHPQLKGLLLIIIELVEWLDYLIQVIQHPKKRGQLVKMIGIGGLIIFGCHNIWNLLKPTEMIEIKHRIDSEFFQELMIEILPFQLKENKLLERKLWIRNDEFK